MSETEGQEHDESVESKIGIDDVAVLSEKTQNDEVLV